MARPDRMVYFIQFLESVSGLLDLKYASAGYDMASNIFHYHGSVGQVVRALKNLPYVNGYTEWGPAYRLKVKTQNGIPYPNFIQAFSSEFFSKVQISSAEPHAGLYAKRMHDLWFLDILDHRKGQMAEPYLSEIENRYTALYERLKSMVLLYDRPVYMKADEWANRQNRFVSRT